MLSDVHTKFFASSSHTGRMHEGKQHKCHLVHFFARMSNVKLCASRQSFGVRSDFKFVQAYTIGSQAYKRPSKRFVGYTSLAVASQTNCCKFFPVTGAKSSMGGRAFRGQTALSYSETATVEPSRISRSRSRYVLTLTGYFEMRGCL